MTGALNHAIEAAIRRAYALGRVDEAIERAAEELERMVAAEPDITPGEVLRRYGEDAGKWIMPDWDHALWTLADVWCELQRELRGQPARRLPTSPYSVLCHEIAAREAAAAHR